MKEIEVSCCLRVMTTDMEMIANDTVAVQIVDREATAAAWGRPGYASVVVRTVAIEPICPSCGGPRGEPRWERFCEDGEHYRVHVWENPCGHLDRYDAILRETMSSN